jgi:hypothetical protein
MAEWEFILLRQFGLADKVVFWGLMRRCLPTLESPRVRVRTDQPGPENTKAPED